jgi:hypothetical protein
MRNHSDSLMTASWHATLAGRKWWYVCSPRGDGECYETVAPRGGIVIYGTGKCTSTFAQTDGLDAVWWVRGGYSQMAAIALL